MTDDTRTRTTTQVRANTARTAATHDDAGPLVWIVVLPLFVACLVTAIAAHRAASVEQRRHAKNRAEVKRMLTPVQYRAMRREVSHV